MLPDADQLPYLGSDGLLPRLLIETLHHSKRPSASRTQWVSMDMLNPPDEGNISVLRQCPRSRLSNFSLAGVEEETAVTVVETGAGLAALTGGLKTASVP